MSETANVVPPELFGQLMTMLDNVVSEKTVKKKKIKSVKFEHEGHKIILPTGMDYGQAIEQLKLKQAEEETQVQIHEEIDCFPLDGAYMLMRVLQGRYGWASPCPTPGFFGPNPPVMVGFEIAPGEFTQIIWGGFKMPGIEGQLQTSSSRKNGRFIFAITGKVKKKHEHQVLKIAAEVRQRIKQESVYKGKAIRVVTNDDGEITDGTAPSFIDTSRVNEEELVLPTEVQTEVDVSIWTPIMYTANCREHRIPLKRGILLEGPYGTGKTLTAYVTAKRCNQNGWTFIYLDRVAGLGEALQFARQYSPAVVFAEDIDRAVSGEERSVSIDDVLNTIDGIESKNTEIITILTTNHVDKINRAMLRPGRLDAVISIQAPDKVAAEKLIRIYGKGRIADGVCLDQASHELAGQIPAVIREVVERAKMHAICRAKGSGALELSDGDLAHAAKSMKHHLELMNPKPVTIRSTEENVGHFFKNAVRESIELAAGAVVKEAIRKNIQEDYLVEA